MDEVYKQIPCSSCPLGAQPGLRQLDADQLAYMEDFKDREISLTRGEALIEEGQHTSRLYTLLEGVMIRFHSLEDGRRQIVNFMFPGDLVGLQAAFDEPARHSVESLTAARLCVFRNEDFVDLIGHQPRFGYDLTWLAAKEETALEGHMVSLGQRSAKERLTYLAVWLVDRALSTGVADDDRNLRVPITQTQIADMLGLSLVHTNRTIRQLEREGLVIWGSRKIRIPDMDRACEFAKFDRTHGRLRPFI